MKNIALLLLMSCVSIFTISAQDQYTKGMEKAMDLWHTGNNTEAVALFERIANVEKDNWLPSYYAANVLIVQSFGSKDMTTTNDILEKAKIYIAEAHKRSESNSEIYTLEGLLYTGYVAMDPATYGMTLSGKIMELHSKAVALDPNNPRAKNNQIEYEMGGARFFGQPMAPFCKRLESVIPMYDAQNTEIPFAPTYGKERLIETIENCGK